MSGSLLTKNATGPVADIYHRMPVILAPGQLDLWPSSGTSAEQVHGAVALSSEAFTAYPVTPDVGNTRNDYPS